MSVYKKIQLPSKVMCSAAAMSSADEEIAIATDEGVYILVSRKVLSEIFIYMYYLSHRVRGIYTSDLGPQAKSARRRSRPAKYF